MVRANKKKVPKVGGMPVSVKFGLQAPSGLRVVAKQSHKRSILYRLPNPPADPAHRLRSVGRSLVIIQA